MSSRTLVAFGLLAASSLMPATAAASDVRLEPLRTVLVQPPIRNPNEGVWLHDAFVVITRTDVPDNATPVIVEIATGRSISAPFMKGGFLLDATESTWIIGHPSAQLEIVDRATGRLRAKLDLSKDLPGLMSTDRVHLLTLQFTTRRDEFWIAENRPSQGTMLFRFALPDLRPFAPILLPVNGRVTTWEDKLVIGGSPAGIKGANKAVVEILGPHFEKLASIPLPQTNSESLDRDMYDCGGGFADIKGSLLVFTPNCDVALVVDLRTRRLVNAINGLARDPNFPGTLYTLYQGRLLARYLVAVPGVVGLQSKLILSELEQAGRSTQIDVEGSDVQLSRAGVGINRWEPKIGATTAFDVYAVRGKP